MAEDRFLMSEVIYEQGKSVEIEDYATDEDPADFFEDNNNDKE